MTYPYPPQGQGYPVQQPPVPTERNVVGIIALIAGILGFIFACIPPGALIVGWVLLPVAFVLGVVGVCLSGKDKGTSIAAICLSIVGVIVGVVVFFRRGREFLRRRIQRIRPLGGRASPLPSTAPR